MRRLQAQTWDDLSYFLEERNKFPWRTWDAYNTEKYKKSDVVAYSMGSGRYHFEGMDPKIENKVLQFWFERLT